MSAYHVEKQESLPFPPAPMAGRASLTMQESVYEQRVDAAPASRRCSEHLDRADGRRGPRPAVDVRR